MADTVTSQEIQDGRRNVVYKLTNLSDGTGESAVLKIDVSALDGAPDEVVIERVDYDINGMTVNLLWDATADVSALLLGPGQASMDFRDIGGIKNNSGAGKTGDLLLTTAGHTANDSYTIILHMRKRWAQGR
jgi:hypothetical protein